MKVSLIKQKGIKLSPDYCSPRISWMLAVWCNGISLEKKKAQRANFLCGKILR